MIAWQAAIGNDGPRHGIATAAALIEVVAMQPVLLSWSGGKDAAWALHVLRQRDDVKVVALFTTVTEGYERVSMQGIALPVLRAQAAAVGLPVIEARMPQRASNEIYERSVAAGLAEVRRRWPDCNSIAFGDLLLEEIRAYREALCAGLGWTPMFPIFGVDTAALAREMIAQGLEAQLCCVDTAQLDARFAGRPFDTQLLADLPAEVDRCGERGEFHTCVTAGPMFSHPLAVVRGEQLLREDRFLYTDYQLASGD